MSPGTRRGSRTRPAPAWTNWWSTSTAGPEHRAWRPTENSRKNRWRTGGCRLLPSGAHLGTGVAPGASHFGGDALTALLCTADAGGAALVFHLPALGAP